MKSILIYAGVLLVLVVAPLGAQTFVTQIGDETTAPSGSSGTPVYRSTAGSSCDWSVTQTLYPASMLGIPVGATISGLHYHKRTSGASVAAEHTLQVMFKETTQTSYTSGDTFANVTAGTTMAFDSSTFAMPATIGWVNFGPFNQAPFVYQGGNLEVIVYWDCSFTATDPVTGGFSWSYEPYGGGLGRGYGNTCGQPGPATNISEAGIQTHTRYPVVRFDWTPPAGNSVFIANNTSQNTTLPTTATDMVMLDLELHAFNAGQTLNSVTFTKFGNVVDGDIDNVKLVRDMNDNGVIDAGEPVLGSGTLTVGAITFPVSPGISVAPSVPERLLFAASYASALSPTEELGFEINTASDVSWSGGTDVSVYPVTSPLRIVPMAGTFTIANGNPGGSYDFGDIGEAFDALENYGVSGSVTLDVFDAGGPFASGVKYSLGLTDSGLAAPIANASVTNSITLRAAPGQNPVVNGSGAIAPWSNRAGTMGIYNVAGVTVEGLEISGGTFYGVAIIRSGNSSSVEDITVRRCKIHSTQGPAVMVWANGGGLARVTIDGCFIYDCNLVNTSGFSSYAVGLIAISQVTGPNLVTNNTIVHRDGAAATAGVTVQLASSITRDITLTNNVIINENPSGVCVSASHVGRFAGANYNCLYATAGEVFLDDTAGTPTPQNFTQWQSGSRDANGLNVDPQLESTTASSMDLHLKTSSPVIGVGDPATTAMLDIDGEARPNGPGFDIGADEFHAAGPTLLVDTQPGTATDAYANETGPGGAGLEATKFAITSNTLGASTLESITLMAAGTGDASTAFSEVALYLDDGNSIFDAADTLYGTPAGAFPSPNGTLTFTSSLAFPVGTLRIFFIVVKLDGVTTALPGETFNFIVEDIDVDAASFKAGVPSAPPMNGILILTPEFTIADNSPALDTAFAGQNGFVIQQFTLTYPEGPDSTITSMTFTGAATAGSPSTDVTTLDLYRDANGNGIFDSGVDALVSSSTGFDASNLATFPLTGTESQFSSSATPIQYFVVVGFAASTPDGSIFQTQLTAASGTTAGATINGVPAPAAGPAPGLEVLANNLIVHLHGPTGAASVDSDDQGPGDHGLVVWDGELSALAQLWTVTELVFTATGSADHSTAYSYVALFEDTNSDGVFNGGTGGDALAVAAAGTEYGGAGNTYAAALTNDAFPAFGTPRRFFLVVKLAGTAETGETLHAELTDAIGSAPSGGVVSGDIGVSSTALIIDSPSLTVANAANQPASVTLNTGVDQGAAVGKFRLTATNFAINVQDISFMALGTGDPTLDLSATNGIEVYLDDGDDAFDSATDTIVYSGAGASPMLATFSPAVAVPANSSEVIWVRLNVPAATGAGNTEARTYSVAIANTTDVSAASTAGTVSVLIGAPLPESATLGVTDFFVTSFSPTSDLPKGGKAITIQGSGFEAPFAVRINGILCQGVAVITPTEVTGLMVPSGGGKNLAIEIDSGFLATQALSQTFSYSTVGSPGSSGSDGCTVATTSAGAWAMLLFTLALAALAFRRVRRREDAC